MSKQRRFSQQTKTSAAAGPGGRVLPEVNGDFSQAAETFLHRALVQVTGVLGLLITVSFFTATYDTAQVKLTLLHMGGLLLAGLWGALQLVRRENPFTRKNFPFLLPVWVYLGWNILCFICAPYHLNALEEFIRFLLYGMITLLAATQFSTEDVKTVTKWILAAAWISVLYALVQVGNIFYPGMDIMPWRGFFGKRVFSVHANPNFYGDFIVFTSCLAGGVFLIKRQKSLLLLMGLGLITLFFTESKGAWLAYAAALAVFAFFYTNACAEKLKRYRKRLNILALVTVVLAIGLTGVYTAKRFQSVSFRTHTWLGTLEMIKDSPVLGVGVGNFKTVYAAYRRPQIFYIENSHNTETQHAENELLEQAAVSGVVGLAIFLGLISFLGILSWRTWHQKGLSQDRRFYLLGYVAALLGIFIHSWMDISIHFASSGYFFALFMGIILALCRPEAEEKPRKVFSPSAGWALGIGRGVLALGLCFCAGWIIYSFYHITISLGKKTLGEMLLLGLSWAVLAGSLAGGGYVVWKSARKIRSWPALVPLLVLIPLEALAYCPFQANHLYSLGIAVYKMRDMEGALACFTQAIKWNPLKTEMYQFRANLLADILDLTPRLSITHGDRQTPSDDFTRAVRDFQVVQDRAPNHPLLYHNKGQLYYKMALNRSEAARRARNIVEYEELKRAALDQMVLAKKSFTRSLVADPVNPVTYTYLIQIALLENNLEEAERWIARFEKGHPLITEEEFLRRNREYQPIQQLKKQVQLRRAQTGQPAHS